MTVVHVRAMYSDFNLVWKSWILLSIHPDSSFSYYCLAQAECEPVRDMVATDITSTSILPDYFFLNKNKISLAKLIQNFK